MKELRLAHGVASLVVLCLVAISCTGEIGDPPDKHMDYESPQIGDAPPVPPGVDGPPGFIFGQQCQSLSFRESQGALEHGTFIIRVRARIAVSANGTHAATEQRVKNDIGVLNEAFASTKIQFVLEDLQFLPEDDTFFEDDTYNTDNQILWSNMCTGAESGFSVDGHPLHTDAVGIFYVNDIPGNVAGYGGFCGVVIEATNTTKGVTPKALIAQEVAHSFGLEHTHECLHNADAPDDESLNGDGIPDTPVDPGPKRALTCFPGGHSQQSITFVGSCTQAADCTISCTAGETPDDGNFMSYYRWECADHFTNGQGLLMRCVLSSGKSNLIWCPADQTRCGTQCFDTDWNVNNCGVCGNSCGPERVCKEAKCKCDNAQTWCENAGCKDTSSDPAHCGGCNNACPAGQVCDAGQCSPMCDAGATDCGGSCVDLNVDENNCGVCGNVCPQNVMCASGGCAGCAGGTRDCSGACVSYADPNNCGKCGKVCGAGDKCTFTRCPVGSCPTAALRHCCDTPARDCATIACPQGTLIRQDFFSPANTCVCCQD